MRLVLEGLPGLALLVAHGSSVQGRAGNLDVVGDHDRARVEPATIDDALQVGQIRVLVVIEEHEIQCAGVEAVFGGQCVQSASTVPDRADDARYPVGDACMRPDPSGVDRVGLGQFDRIDLRVGRGRRDA